ncbi:MAG: HTTM domain-containing protein [Phycisphaeraceae bacterium]
MSSRERTDVRLTWKMWFTAPATAWQAYWFRPVPLMRLALVRIIFVACHLLFFFPSLQRQRMLVENNDAFIEPQVIVQVVTAIVPEHLFRTLETVTTLWALTFAAGLFALVGLFTRTMLFAMAAGSALLVAHNFSYGTHHHPQALFTIVLFLLALAPCGAVLSVDAWWKARRTNDEAAGTLDEQRQRLSTLAFWPLLSAQWLLAMAYFSAGVCKLYIGGLTWFNGTTMQAYLLEDAIRWNRPLGLWAAQQWELALAMSFFAVGFELAFPLVLLFRRLVPWFVIAGLSMHMGIFVLQAAPFWQFMLLYLVFVPVERVWDWARQPRGVMPTPTTG